MWVSTVTGCRFLDFDENMETAFLFAPCGQALSVKQGFLEMHQAFGGFFFKVW